MDHSFIFETLGDTPENIELVNETLFDVKSMLYGASYTAQKNLADMYRYTCNFSEGMLVDGTSYVFTIPYTYIELLNRIDFKESEHYNNFTFYKDIIKKQDMFQKSILVYINGKMYTNFYVKFVEDKTYIKFNRYKASEKHIVDGFTISDLRELQDGIISFVFMPMCKYKTGKFTTQTLTNTNTMFTRSSAFIESADIQVSDKPMLLMYPKNISATYSDTHGYMFDYTNELNINILEYSATELSDVIDELNMVVNNYNYFMVELMYPKYLHDIITVDSDGWFETDILDLPIPTENMIIYRKTSTGLVFDHVSEIDMSYPNIYKILTDNPSDSGYVVYVFYNNVTDDISYYHMNELDMYYSFIQGILDKYKNNSIPSYIKNYNPVYTDYSIANYRSTYTSRATRDTRGLEYKINKLRYLIENNPFLYTIYLDKYANKYPTVSKIVDNNFMNIRLRADTSHELPNLSPAVQFIEYDDGGNVTIPGRYLFSVRASSYNQACVMFIDNKFVYTDELYYDNGVYYIYIQYDKVHIGSKIEMVFINDVSMSLPITLNTVTPLEVKLSPEYDVTPNDLFITKSTGAIVKTTISGVEQADIDASIITVRDGTFIGEYNSIVINSVVRHRVVIPSDGFEAGDYCITIGSVMYGFTLPTNLSNTDTLDVTVSEEYVDGGYEIYESIDTSIRVGQLDDIVISGIRYRKIRMNVETVYTSNSFPPSGIYVPGSLPGSIYDTETVYYVHVNDAYYTFMFSIEPSMFDVLTIIVNGDDISGTHLNRDSRFQPTIVPITLTQHMFHNDVADYVEISLQTPSINAIDGYKKYNTIHILATDQELDGVSGLVLRSDKVNIFKHSIGESPNQYITKYIDCDRRNFMVFRDGRLMSKSLSALSISKNDNPFGPHTVYSNFTLDETTPVTIVHSSDKYDMVCEYNTATVKRLRFYQRNPESYSDITGRENNIYNSILSSDRNALMTAMSQEGYFVDLTNMLTRPIDFTWYDIYLNGLRLTEEDVIIVSPYQMVIMVDDDYPDINSFVIIDITGFIHDYMIQISPINPDMQQVTDTIISEYPELIDSNNNIFLDANATMNIRSNILLDPDEEIGYTTPNGN